MEKEDFFPHSPDNFADEYRIQRLPMVYAVASLDLKYIKIGRATNFKSRFSAIQCGCPHKLTLLRAVRTPIAVNVESYIHEQLEHVRIRGEWFSLPDAEFDWLDDFFRLTNQEVVRVARIGFSQFHDVGTKGALCTTSS